MNNKNNTVQHKLSNKSKFAWYLQKRFYGMNVVGALVTIPFTHL